MLALDVSDWKSRTAPICFKTMRNGPTYCTRCDFGGMPGVSPIEPSPVKKLGVISALAAMMSSASKNGLSAISRSRAGFVVSPPICSRMSVIRFPDWA